LPYIIHTHPEEGHVVDENAPAKAKYINKTVEGVITSVVFKQSQSQRSYSVIVLDGQEYTCWDDTVGQIAQTAIDHRVSAKVSQKEGTSYWNIRGIDVLGPATTTQDTPADEGLSIRIAALHAASRVYAGTSTGNAEVITALARSFEIYLMGLDVDGDGNTGA
jgi:hypothetical protein